MLEMCVIIAMPTWPEKVADVISEVLHVDFPGSMQHAPSAPYSRMACFPCYIINSFPYLAALPYLCLTYSGYATVHGAFPSVVLF